jgi:class 3 adenylate cyclase/tetratricopeptide (TPR) repeat protein
MGRKPDDPDKRARKRSEPAELPKGILTFLLTDIEGSTPLWERHGAVMGAALTQHQALIARTVAAYAGRLIKTQGEGDSTLSVFVRASDAVAAALTMQQALDRKRWPAGIMLPTRAALHTGEAELRDRDYFGQALNRAARLRALGRGGQILLSRATAELVADQLPKGAGLVDVGSHLLKGLSRPENVFAIVHPDLAAPPPALTERAEHPDRVAFVGHQAERAELGAALDSALGGQGQLVLIAGEAGIGKTRITEELCAEARSREARVAWGRCREGTGAPAYWPWRQALRAYAAGRPPEEVTAELGREVAELAQLLPELARVEESRRPATELDPEMARFRLFDAMTSCLRSAAAARGLVVVLDDLHWADRASLLLLGFVAGELADTRLLVVGTYRDVEVDRRHPLSGALAELFRQPATSYLSLSGLDRGDVGRFIADVAGIDPAVDLVTAVHSQTEGNPYFVSELVRLLTAERRLEAGGLLSAGIPEGIRHVIGRRLNRLSDAANSSLTAASVQGRDFDLDVVARVTGLPPGDVLDSLEEAMDARMVVEVETRPGRFRFAHALVREALYEELPSRERRRLHDRVGAALVELRGDDFERHLAELAHHFSQAARPGQADQAAAYARQAGDRAMKVLAYEEAASHYQRALRAIDLQVRPDEAERCELLLALASARMAAGEPGEARAQYKRAAELAQRMGHGEQLARAAFGLGKEFTAGSVDELEVSLLEETLTALGKADSALRARVLARLAKALQSSPHPDRRSQLSQAAVVMARRLGDPPTLAAVLYEYHMATWGPDNLHERLAVANEVVQLAEASGDKVTGLRGRGFLLANQLEQGDLPALELGLESYDRAAQELQQLHFSWHVPLFRAGQELLHGRLDEADRLTKEALTLGQRAHDPVVTIYHAIVLVGLRWEQGRLPELEATLRRFVDRFPANLGWRATLAVLLCEAGRHDEARQQVERLAADDFAGLPRNHLYLYHLAVLAIACHALGDQRRASRLYELLLPYADRNVLVARLPLGTLGSASQHLGLLAATMSRWNDAAIHFQTAIEAHERMGATVLLARSREDLARTLRTKDGNHGKDTTAVFRGSGMVEPA